MTGRDHQVREGFGFARGAQSRLERPQAHLRLVHAKDEQTAEAILPSDAIVPVKATPKPVWVAPTVPTPSPKEAEASHWVVRPKASRPTEAEPKGQEPKRRRTSNPAFVTSGPLRVNPVPESDSHPRHWLVLGLVGMVYVVGIAGLWSMVQSFDETASTPLTPAGSNDILSPVDEVIDLRDARLDGPIIPQFRPSGPIGPGDDVAASDLQSSG